MSVSDRFKSKQNIVITCLPRISEILEGELTELGYPPESSDALSVSLKGNLHDAMYLNYHLRTGNRVLFQIDEFNSVHPDELYKKTKRIPWEEIIPGKGYFSVSSYAKNKFIRDTRFANLRIKDAIVDRFRNATGARPDSGPDTNHTVIFVHWKENKVKVFIDTSGETISKHGYRVNPWKAPLQESLASAIIRQSAWDGESTFVNPMCGSGTLAIEAALIATGQYPGQFRKNYGFMHIKGWEDKEWEKIRKSASSKTQPEPKFDIIATDNNRRAIEAARENARKAGVDKYIRFEKCDFRKTPVPSSPGVVIINPEYGERMGDLVQLEDIYSGIGDFFKQNCTGHMGYVFTGNLDLAKKIGLKARRKYLFYNGKIDCRLLEYEMYTGSRRT